MEQCWKELMLKNSQCDICSKQVQYKFQLNTLREIYQTEDIVQLCEDCCSDINKQLHKLQNNCWNRKITVGEISKKLKEYITRFKVLREKGKTNRFKIGYFSKGIGAKNARY